MRIDQSFFIDFSDVRRSGLSREINTKVLSQQKLAQFTTLYILS